MATQLLTRDLSPTTWRLDGRGNPLRDACGGPLLDPGYAMQQSLAQVQSVAPHEGDEPIPGFRLVRRRGRGGFGEVWEAEAPGGFLVALKFVRLSGRARDAELRALEFVRGIHHPNLLANFGSWQVDDTLIIGMELADRSLWDRHVEALQQGLRGIPRGELLGYLAEVAAGISYLNDYRHTLDGRAGFGIQHRDLKPSNILLFGGGAKVADLGMARAMDTEVAGHTGIWTFAYAAPEFFRGETTRQSDQYGLAATYCQLRCGRLPFDGSAASMTAGHLFGQPDLESLPEPERPIVERALAKSPGDRWPDCRAFIEALRAVPADSVPDILVDPEGPSDIPREFRSSTGAISGLPDGLGSPAFGGAPSGWEPGDSGSFGPDSALAFAGTSGFADPFPSSDEISPSLDAVPTLILSATSPNGEPAVGGSRGPSRRMAWIGLAVAASAAVAVIVATSGSPIPGRHEAGPAEVAPRLAPAPMLVLADGIGSAASAPEPDDPTTASLPSLPGVPGGAMAAPESPGPAPIEPLPTPVVEASQSAPTEPASSPSEAGPAPGPVPDPILEGPIEMEAAGVEALAPAPKGAGEGPEDDEAPPPPEAGERDEAWPTGPAQVVGPPVPDRKLPDPASRLVAHNASTSPVGPAREPAPNRSQDSGAANPRPAEAAFKRGQEHYLQGAYLRAYAEFDQAIRLDPGHLPSYFPRAVARHRAGDPRAALADYADAIRVGPDDVSSYISRGQAHHELRDYRRAIADFDEALRRAPGDPDARFRRGLSRHKIGDYGGAVADFTETLRVDPKNALAAAFRAEALARLVAKDALASAPGRPSAGAVVSGATAPGVAGGRLPIRETGHLAAPPSNGPQPRVVAPAAIVRPKPAPQERRPLPGLLPWPFMRRR